MKNVYDIRREKGLYFVLPDNCVIDESLSIEKLAIGIIVNLYYEENIYWYLEQLSVLDKIADIYIVTSNEAMFKIIIDAGYTLIKKKNRGRDISALLVAAKDIVKKYQYICFLHDKKEKSEKDALMVKLWVENLWFNTVKSASYVKNIINIFQRNSSIGLLVPPEPMENNWYIWGETLWQGNFEITRRLCDELALNCDVDSYIPPITLGSVFWCRTEALKKLFEKYWSYNDFPEEPLADDGTISHAIERILAFVAQDAGYDTGTIMCTSFAAKNITMLRDSMPKAIYLLKNLLGIHSIDNLNYYLNSIKRIEKFCNRHKKVYLYGAGKVGIECLSVLKAIGVLPIAFIVTEKTDNSEQYGIPIIKLEEVVDTKDCGIIVSVGHALKNEVMGVLDTKGISDYICYIE